MKWRRQRPTTENRNASAGLDETKVAIEVDAVLNAEARIEIEQVSTAAEQHMLAIVDDFRILAGRRERKRGGDLFRKETVQFWVLF